MAPQTRKAIRIPCALLYPEDKVVVAGEKFRLPHTSSAELVVSAPMLGEPFVQITIFLDRKKTTDASYVRAVDGHPFGKKSMYLDVSVRFPVNTFTTSCEELSDELHQTIFNAPAGEKKMGVIRLTLLPDEQPVFRNVGSPFVGSDDETSQLVLDGGLLQGFRSLRDILTQTEFHLLVKDCGYKARADVSFARDLKTELPPAYPYGRRHEWNMDRYRTTINPMELSKFRVIFAHDSVNHAQTAITQSAVQDVFFLAEDVAEMRNMEVQARFVRVHKDPTHTDYNQQFYAVMQVPFADTYSKSFSRLIKPGSCAHLAFAPAATTAATDGDNNNGA